MRAVKDASRPAARSRGEIPRRQLVQRLIHALRSCKGCEFVVCAAQSPPPHSLHPSRTGWKPEAARPRRRTRRLGCILRMEMTMNNRLLKTHYEGRSSRAGRRARHDAARDPRNAVGDPRTRPARRRAGRRGHVDRRRLGLTVGEAQGDAAVVVIGNGLARQAFETAGPLAGPPGAMVGANRRPSPAARLGPARLGWRDVVAFIIVTENTP